jgi:hypothetical protein
VAAGGVEPKRPWDAFSSTGPISTKDTGAEGEHVPAAPQLAGAAQALEEADLGRVEHDQPLDATTR